MNGPVAPERAAQSVRPGGAPRPTFPASTPPRGGERERVIARAVAADVAPSPSMEHQTGPAASSAPQGARSIAAPDVSDFVTAVLGPDDAAATAFVATLLADQVRIEAIYLDLLAPAARDLGQRWEEDECSFVDVTVAMGRLHRVLRDLSDAFRNDGAQPAQAGQVLLTCLPGEQHTLGLIMVAEFLIRDGFRVHVGSPWVDADLLDLLRDEWFDVVGVSAGCEHRLTTLSHEIPRLRAASRNPDVRVLVGGQVFAHDPTLAQRIGADGWATDAASSVDSVRTWCRPRRHRPPSPGAAS
jgi:methanogenic corrinoid protein MtbC1